MARSRLDREAISKRFIANMGRVGAITRVLYSGGDGLKQTGFAQSEGARADILRATVVFLHVSFEDFIQSQIPSGRFIFSSKSNNLKQALGRLNIKNVGAFTDLFPSLDQLARRRHRIVHHADLDDDTGEMVKPWNIVDEWQIIQWHLVVIAFYHRLRKDTGRTNKVEDRAQENVEKALVKNVEFARAMIAFPHLPPEQHLEGLKNLSEMADGLREILRLEVGMFLDSDGRPVEGAV
jgi:hypothetical protein